MCACMCARVHLCKLVFNNTDRRQHYINKFDNAHKSYDIQCGKILYSVLRKNDFITLFNFVTCFCSTDFSNSLVFTVISFILHAIYNVSCLIVRLHVLYVSLPLRLLVRLLVCLVCFY